MALQDFTMDQEHLIDKGKMSRQTLRNLIDEALNNNTFQDNFIIQSLPGLGKSWETQRALDLMTTKPLKIEGSTSISSFGIDLATARYMTKGQLVVVLDDCDSLFDPKNINTLKGMFGNTRTYSYNLDIKRLFPTMSDLNVEAVKSFMQPDRKGFFVPLHDVTFIILTNIEMPDVNQTEAASEKSIKKGNDYSHLHAIRRRSEYKFIKMSRPQLWGYVADVVLNEHICEKFMPSINRDQKVQMLNWMYNNWDNVTERNLSLAEKLTKKMVRYSDNYLDMWQQDFISM